MKQKRVLLRSDGTIRELIPQVDWHHEVNWRSMRIGVSLEESMWEFSVPGFTVWCDRYHKHGKELSEFPKDARITVVP